MPKAEENSKTPEFNPSKTKQKTIMKIRIAEKQAFPRLGEVWGYKAE